MAIGDIIVGIDIGTTKVCTVVGEVNNFGQIETISSTSYKCSGLKKGKIINEDEISLSIAKTIKDAEDETNLKINSAYVTIPGKYVTIVQNSIDKSNKSHRSTRITSFGRYCIRQNCIRKWNSSNRSSRKYKFKFYNECTNNFSPKRICKKININI